MTSEVAPNLARLRHRIADAAQAANRPADDITLVAVSKTQPLEKIREAAAAGQTHFGENYLQEALDKIQALDEHNLTWHFIGPLQSNKTRDIAAYFDWVHSVDRLKIARRLSDQRPDDLPPLNLCLQVNISNEPSKSGVSVQACADLATEIAKLPRLRLRGLMAIPAWSESEAEQRKPFAQLRQLHAELCASGLELDTLSMGMSDDLEAAILEGASIIRIGTAIFGSRTETQ